MKLGKTLTNFYGRFHKSIDKIDQLVWEGKICREFYMSLDTLIRLQKSKELTTT